MAAGPREPVLTELDAVDVCLDTFALPGAAAAAPDTFEGPLTATTDLELEGAVVAVAICTLKVIPGTYGTC